MSELEKTQEEMENEALDIIMSAPLNPDFVNGEQEHEDSAAQENYDEDGSDEELENAEPVKKKKAKYVTSDELYTIIQSRPGHRVVLHTDSGMDWMRPLEFIYADDALQFKEDATSTQMHPHGLCEDVLDLCGTEGCPSSMIGHPVKIGGLYIEHWDTDYKKVVKVRKQDNEKWIRLYLEEEKRNED